VAKQRVRPIVDVPVWELRERPEAPDLTAGRLVRELVSGGASLEGADSVI
jgi:hypothetical protein